MYQISTFSKLSNTSIQTLRYYDNLELLTPKTIGKYNNYRYYTKDQLLILKKIKKLKSMGFKLKDISQIINRYDEKFLILHKIELQKEVNNKLKSIKEIEEIIDKIKNKKQNYNQELVNLINQEERRKINMKEKYNDAKKKLLKCYNLYQQGNFEKCLITMEELKNDIFKDNNYEIDSFWSNSAGDLFTGIFLEVLKNNIIEEVTFLNIFHFKVSNKEFIDNLTEYTNSLDKDSYSYLSLSGISSAPSETKASVISVFKQKLKLYAMFDTKK